MINRSFPLLHISRSRSPMPPYGRVGPSFRSGFHSIVQYVPVMPSWVQRQFRASPRPRGNDAFDGHRHDLTRVGKLPCETIHLVLVILAARRNKVFPLHGAASHHIHNAEGHAHGCRGTPSYRRFRASWRHPSPEPLPTPSRTTTRSSPLPWRRAMSPCAASSKWPAPRQARN